MIPEIDSIKEDLPALCDPVTAITGRSMSTWTLETAKNVRNGKRGIKTNSYRPCEVERIDDV